MTLAAIWLVALAVALVASTLWAARWLLAKRWDWLAWIAGVCGCGTYCLLAMDASSRVSHTDAGMALAYRFGISALLAGALVLQFVAVHWILQEGRVKRRALCLAGVTLVQILVGGIAGWRFYDALAAGTAPALAETLDLEPLPGEGLITDRGRYISVFKLRDPLSQDRSQELHRPYQPDGEMMSEAIRSNCHGWVFTRGRYIVDGPGVEMILEDNGYEVVESPQVGDVVVYRDKTGAIIHTGLVRTVEDGQVWVESKWGIRNRFIHRPQALPLVIGYYRTLRNPEWLRIRASHLVKIRTDSVLVMDTQDTLGNPAGETQTVQHAIWPIGVDDELPLGAE